MDRVVRPHRHRRRHHRGRGRPRRARACAPPGMALSGPPSKSSKPSTAACGTSSRAEIGLAYQALAERQRLLRKRTAPGRCRSSSPTFGSGGVIPAKIHARWARSAMWGSTRPAGGGSAAPRTPLTSTRPWLSAHASAGPAGVRALYHDADCSRLVVTVLRTAVPEFARRVHQPRARRRPAQVRTDRASSTVSTSRCSTPGPGPGARSGSRSRPVRSSTPQVCGPTRSAPSTRAPTPTRSGPPRVISITVPWVKVRKTSRLSSPSPATSARCS